MARCRVTVRELAQELKLDLESTLISLMELGLPVDRGADLIPKSRLANVRAALGLPASLPRDHRGEITVLAAQASLPEAEVRKRLVNAGVLKKTRKKKVPRGLSRRAEIALGISRAFIPAMPTAPALPLGRREAERAERRRRRAWKIIGPEQRLVHVTPDNVAAVHGALVADFKNSKDPIDPPGVRSQDLLDSAVYRSRTSLGENSKYPSVAMAGASLLYGVVHTHPFHNGNKRTAIVSLLAFLDLNGWVLTVDQDDIYDFLLDLADHRLVDERGIQVMGVDEEVVHVARWVQRNIRRVGRREYRLQFRQLRSILEKYGCKLAPIPGNRINIHRGFSWTQIGYRNEGEDVEKQTIRKVRKDLELDEEHGYDSDIFYDAGPRIPDFINKYRKLLDRLAKV